MRYVIDSNIWIAFFRKNQKVITRLEAILVQGHEICVIPIVYYEVLRGLEKRQDHEKMDGIKRYWRTLSYYECTKLIWDEAIRLWARTIRHNIMPGDKDVLIAAFALQLGATVVTRNVKHFSPLRIPIENWIDD